MPFRIDLSFEFRWRGWLAPAGAPPQRIQEEEARETGTYLKFIKAFRAAVGGLPMSEMPAASSVFDGITLPPEPRMVSSLRTPYLSAIAALSKGRALESRLAYSTFGSDEMKEVRDLLNTVKSFRKEYDGLSRRLTTALVGLIQKDIKKKLTEVEAVTREALTPEKAELILCAFDCMDKVQSIVKDFAPDIIALERQLGSRFYDYKNHRTPSEIHDWVPMPAAGSQKFAIGCVNAIKRTGRELDQYCTDNYPSETQAAKGYIPSTPGWVKKGYEKAKEIRDWTHDWAYDRGLPACKSICSTARGIFQNPRGLIKKAGWALVAGSSAILLNNLEISKTTPSVGGCHWSLERMQNRNATSCFEVLREQCSPASTLERSPYTLGAALVLPIAFYMANPEWVNAGVGSLWNKTIASFGSGKAWVMAKLNQAINAPVAGRPVVLALPDEDSDREDDADVPPADGIEVLAQPDVPPANGIEVPAWPVRGVNPFDEEDGEHPNIPGGP